MGPVIVGVMGTAPSTSRWAWSMHLDERRVESEMTERCEDLVYVYPVACSVPRHPPDSSSSKCDSSYRITRSGWLHRYQPAAWHSAWT
jgi:hypothetical protein